MAMTRDEARTFGRGYGVPANTVDFLIELGIIEVVAPPDPFKEKIKKALHGYANEDWLIGRLKLVGLEIVEKKETS